MWILIEGEVCTRLKHWVVKIRIEGTAYSTKSLLVGHGDLSIILSDHLDAVDDRV